MLISFTVANWQSFKEETTFSMLATSEKQHLERLPYIEKFNKRILPIAAFYGGNASGKTNFCVALEFARDRIVKGSRINEKISTKPFLLDSEYSSKPSKFSFVIIVGDKCYEYGFKLTSERIVEEWLIQILKTTEQELYYRNKERIDLQKSALEKNKDIKFLTGRTRDNQLFLTNTVDQNIEYFKPIYDWFLHNLILIKPNSRCLGTEELLQTRGKDMNRQLANLDTGISQIKPKPVPFEALQIPDKIKEEMIEENIDFKFLTDKERYLIKQENGKLKSFKLVSYHQNRDGKEIEFGLENESDGTLRIIDLLPAFLHPLKNSKTVIIDELDRSLHTILTKTLLKIYLSSCQADSRSQLLFTTHDVLLMDQDLLRRDEMWITERNHLGESTLIALSDYKNIRADKDIRKSYLLGMFGGVPNILLDDLLILKEDNGSKK
jgi:AAA15 family ATPase/GTPase